MREPRLRIALVAHEIHEGGGMERAFAELVRRVHRDYDLVVLSRALALDLRPLVRWRRIPVPPRPATVTFPLFFALAGLELARTRADLVHVLGPIVPNRADLATVQFCHAGFVAATGRLAPPGVPPLRRLNTSVARAQCRLAERWCYRPARTRALAAVSNGIGVELETHYPGLPVAVTPNGVDMLRFRPDAAVRAQVRAERGVDDGRLVALFVGGDWDRKGLGVAIEGLARASAVSADVLELWVVGAGDRRRFGDRARELGVGDRVRFFGSRVDTERFCQAADVFVFPTAYEAFPLAALEAAASGLPLVATLANGLDELIGADIAGLRVERSGTAVGAALARLGCDPELRRRLGIGARARASEYPWERFAEGVSRLYDDLARRTLAEVWSPA